MFSANFDRYFMKIRKATIEDLPLVREIGTQTYRATYPSILGEEQVQYMLDKFYTPEALAGQMEEGHIFWLCFLDSIPAAFVSFSRTQSLEQTWHLQKIYILPKMQGKGIGRTLLTRVADYCREAGAQGVRLNVNRYNKARYFYEKLGFRVIREEDISIGQGYFMNDYLMELDLTKTEDGIR